MFQRKFSCKFVSSPELKVAVQPSSLHKSDAKARKRAFPTKQNEEETIAGKMREIKVLIFRLFEERVACGRGEGLELLS